MAGAANPRWRFPVFRLQSNAGLAAAVSQLQDTAEHGEAAPAPRKLVLREIA